MGTSKILNQSSIVALKPNADFIGIEILDDEIMETTEAFELELFDPQGSTLGDITKITIYISNNDGGEPPKSPATPDKPIANTASGGGAMLFIVLVLLMTNILRFRIGAQGRTKLSL